MKTHKDFENPYYDEFLQSGILTDREWFKLIRNGDPKSLCDNVINSYRKREEWTNKYAWAIPTEEAIDWIIVRLGGKKMIEIGAGTGYWAWLLQQKGVDIVAIDKIPPNGKQDNHYHKNSKTWTHVIEGGPELIEQFPDRVLFVCWPPYQGTMVRQCLEYYKGNQIFYIGENGGCTENIEDSSEDWEALDEDFRIPQYHGIHDYLIEYRRKNASL